MRGDANIEKKKGEGERVPSQRKGDGGIKEGGAEEDGAPQEASIGEGRGDDHPSALTRHIYHKSGNHAKREEKNSREEGQESRTDRRRRTLASRARRLAPAVRRYSSTLKPDHMKNTDTAT